jgi:SAM-dependent methyltransferase
MKTVEYARMFAAEERQWWYSGMRTVSRALLAQELARPQRLRVLDAGCGTGHNLTWLQQLGYAVGVDLSDVALAFGRQRGVTVTRADLARLPFRDEMFDLATSFDVLYHRWVVDDVAVVGELVRVLRPGGLLFVRVPALQWLWGAHDEEVLSRHRYTRSEMAGLLKACGLTQVRATYCNALLFPALALRRTLDRWFRRHGSDVEPLPAPLEWVCRKALEAEAWWLTHGTLPFGSSVVAWGRRAAPAARDSDQAAE